MADNNPEQVKYLPGPERNYTKNTGYLPGVGDYYGVLLVYSWAVGTGIMCFADNVTNILATFWRY